MHPLIHQHNTAIAAACRHYHVRCLEVFGSAARGADFDEVKSDADFLVEFLPMLDGPSLKDFFGLQADLSRILGRAVDLVEASAVRNPYVQAGIDQDRETVYVARLCKIEPAWADRIPDVPQIVAFRNVLIHG